MAARFRDSPLSKLWRLLELSHGSRNIEYEPSYPALAFLGRLASFAPVERRTSCMRQLHSLRSVTPQMSQALKSRNKRSFSTAARASRPGAGRGPVSYTSLALTAITGAGLLLAFQYMQKEKLKEASVKAETAGTAAIGGPFQLIDQDGRPFSDKDLLGEFALLYFGFTFCPDICPDELEKMSEAIDQIEKKTGRQVKPVFISIDPERDSVEQVKSYVSEFHPRLLGLTGSKPQVEQAARQYRVYYTKTDDSADYLVDHSIVMYLLNPEGEFVTFFGKNFTPDQLANSISGQVSKWYIEQSQSAARQRQTANPPA